MSWLRIGRNSYCLCLPSAIESGFSCSKWEPCALHLQNVAGGTVTRNHMNVCHFAIRFEDHLNLLRVKWPASDPQLRDSKSKINSWISMNAWVSQLSHVTNRTKWSMIHNDSQNQKQAIENQCLCNSCGYCNFSLRRSSLVISDGREPTKSLCSLARSQLTGKPLYIWRQHISWAKRPPPFRQEWLLLDYIFSLASSKSCRKVVHLHKIVSPVFSSESKVITVVWQSLRASF